MIPEDSLPMRTQTSPGGLPLPPTAPLPHHHLETAIPAMNYNQPSTTQWYGYTALDNSCMIFETKLQDDVVGAMGMAITKTFTTKEEVCTWLSHNPSKSTPTNPAWGRRSLWTQEPASDLPVPDELTLGSLQLKMIFNSLVKAKAWQKEGKDTTNKEVWIGMILNAQCMITNH